jgi:hypothetical protein
LVDASGDSCDVAVAQQVMELRFEGVCCRAGLPKHKKRESLRETSPLAAESGFLTSFSGF